MSTTSNSSISGGVDRSKVLSAAVASVIGAVVANLVTFFIVGLFYDPPEGFLSLTIPPILLFTAIGTSLGALVFWFLTRRSATPIRTYRIVAAVALVLSIIPNIAAYFNPSMFPIPGGEPMGFLVLILFHVVAAAVSVGIITNRSAA